MVQGKKSPQSPQVQISGTVPAKQGNLQSNWQFSSVLGSLIGGKTGSSVGRVVGPILGLLVAALGARIGPAVLQSSSLGQASLVDSTTIDLMLPSKPGPNLNVGLKRRISADAVVNNPANVKQSLDTILKQIQALRQSRPLSKLNLEALNRLAGLLDIAANLPLTISTQSNEYDPVGVSTVVGEPLSNDFNKVLNDVVGETGEALNSAVLGTEEKKAIAFAGRKALLAGRGRNVFALEDAKNPSLRAQAAINLAENPTLYGETTSQAGLKFLDEVGLSDMARRIRQPIDPIVQFPLRRRMCGLRAAGVIDDFLNPN